MDTNFEQIGPWNGAQDTGKDVRLKWQRNFDRIKANFEELTDLFEKVNLGTDEAPAWAIRAKYGLYTDEWMSAKGKNPSAGSTPMAGATELSKLTDVLLTSPADGQVLTYDTALGKWVNRDPEAAAGLDVEELAENLTTNRYATQDWVTQQGYATQTWASGQFALRTVAINAGTGLTGGGNLTASRTLSLATVGTAGTYTKVTTDRYGRVTDGATLQAGDIPTLSISKISGLQSALDGKLDADDFTELFEKVYVSGYGYAIRAKLALYTEGWLSAKGMNSDAGSTVVAGASSWDEIEGKPSTFPPSAHTHTVAQISDFPKQWAWADVSGKPAPLVNDTYYYGHNETSDFNDAVLGGAYLTRSESWPDNGPSSNYRYGVLAVFYSGISNARIGQLWMSHNGTGGIYARVKFDNNDGSWSFWRRLMDDDCIGSYNAGSATKLQTKRTISLTGAITGSIAFDGSQDVSINTTYSTDNIAALDGRYVNASGDTMTGSLTTPGIQLKGNLFIQGPSTPQGV